jgi:hypothetical protein
LKILSWSCDKTWKKLILRVNLVNSVSWDGGFEVEDFGESAYQRPSEAVPGILRSKHETSVCCCLHEEAIQTKPREVKRDLEWSLEWFGSDLGLLQTYYSEFFRTHYLIILREFLLLLFLLLTISKFLKILFLKKSSYY